MSRRSFVFVFVAALSSLGIACGGSQGSNDNIDDQVSFNTSDAGDAGDAGDALRDAALGADADANADASSTACAQLAPGPFQPQLIGQPFSGSEDLAFDGKGGIVGKKGNALVRVTAQGSTTIGSLPGQTYGLRYHPNGNLIAALPGPGKLVSVSPTGQVTDLVTGLGMPNGVFVDFDGTIWMTEFSGNKVSRIAPNGTRTVVVSGTAKAEAANGVVIDKAKNLLFYTEYSKGKIHRLALDTPNAAPMLVATIADAALDGLVLDACGNVYAVDQGSSRLYRVRIGASNAASAPELLAEFPQNVANAQFGSGPGFDPKRLYVTGNPGAVYAISLGVAGAPVPTPP